MFVFHWWQIEIVPTEYIELLLGYAIGKQQHKFP